MKLKKAKEESKIIIYSSEDDELNRKVAEKLTNRHSFNKSFRKKRLSKTKKFWI